ncbi:MAG: tRNA preQ1(34) S-adenosylmethionine ribosyltransferase-isomerase QueA, partial [Treponema sp.]|nr:tRNA preQ1(34) S-adenosylmethionine ribosyltransferase-isomerase QueA [Treponema sp.]
MQTSDFNFELPEELIAQRPSGQRGNDKLMYLNKTTGQVEHYKMEDLVDLVAPGTLMVFNDSRVRRSRCYGIKTTSGREQEFMFLNPIGDGSSWNTMVKGAKKVKAGNEYKFTDGTTGVIKDVVEGSEFRTISFEKPIDEEWFNRNGHIPLPPYIRREDDDTDSERYQTVYAKETGSAAAPTAGLHFTETILQKLKDKGIELAWVTLHVGLGTFLPVREDNIEDHKMHTEFYTVSEETAAKVAKAKAEGRPVLAVGTTSVRTLESASDEKGNLIPGTRGTNIFMYPGYKFKVVDQMFTNFHTPESTLIMLVSA